VGKVVGGRVGGGRGTIGGITVPVTLTEAVNEVKVVAVGVVEDVISEVVRAVTTEDASSSTTSPTFLESLRIWEVTLKEGARGVVRGVVEEGKGVLEDFGERVVGEVNNVVANGEGKNDKKMKRPSPVPPPSPVPTSPQQQQKQNTPNFSKQQPTKPISLDNLLSDSENDDLPLADVFLSYMRRLASDRKGASPSGDDTKALAMTVAGKIKNSRGGMWNLPVRKVGRIVKEGWETRKRRKEENTGGMIK